MTTEREALDRIAALCDEEEANGGLHDRYWRNEVRAILAAVTPEPEPDYAAVNRSLLRRLQAAGGTLDRDQAGDVLGDLFDWCEAQAAETVFDLTYWLDRLAAAVRPAAGIVLGDRPARGGVEAPAASGDTPIRPSHTFRCGVWLTADGRDLPLSDAFEAPTTATGVSARRRGLGRAGGIPVTPLLLLRLPLAAGQAPRFVPPPGTRQGAEVPCTGQALGC